MDKIFHLKKENLPQIMQLIKDATKDMDDKNIPQWDALYPDQKTIEADIENQTLFGLWIQNTLAGIIVLNEFQDKEYRAIDWKVDDHRPLVVHRLCISPDFQGKGFAKILMDFAENYARQNLYQSIRLDAFLLNPVSLGLYHKLGYDQRGLVTFRKGDFYCFEKAL